ncbi:putative ABC-type Fe3+-siderophore transport system, permease component [Vibrio nigripulchritudo SFn27]|uniref:Putative ABC-type Fe3+-siderophore transport system, permease component n=1 Tax=Vibrio nigripulchritudo TaxID=28173 RepID=U4K3Q3_9VIBR|nr:iron ABC transporter permease [Vibrio nigripulchritudo]CCN81106.1 putative ABC-type Fe3+-siderophore transport system, permease component [Vibrio nigripulchritudo BLFn1]CCN86558.1 putative ABC-type Fe3+-siderophore transport system, permease component [Vibrio nigripulchritudo SFn27]CCN92867.1 putative ABC-type Fe3+-siderophore transport system, permease component [Vibrio nigripulchritudo ENn2]CCO40174.1 putative ABC-type Fe3+-siderophore transport system, permease component [Vibrio nigripulc
MDVTHSQSISQSYLSRVRSKYWILLALGIILTLSVAIDVSVGPGKFAFQVVLETLLDRTAHGVQLEVIIWDYRLPVALTAIIVGAMLGIAGALMQTILNNPLAEPFTLGVSSAASFGAAVAIVIGASVFPVAKDMLVTINAFVFALSTCAVLLVLTRIKGVGTQSMVLFGIAIFFTFSALLSMLEYNASESQLQRIIFWMMGSLSRASWEKIGLGALLLVLVIPFCLSRTWRLTSLRLGEESAKSMGINVSRLRIEILICISLLAATAVSFVGTVGFVGLVGPHIARLLVGEDQRFFLPLSAIIGALVLSITSIVSKSITPGVIYPIGIITALIGVPVFLSIIFSTRKERLS